MKRSFKSRLKAFDNKYLGGRLKKLRSKIRTWGGTSSFIMSKDFCTENIGTAKYCMKAMLL